LIPIRPGDSQLLLKYINEKKAEIESSHEPKLTYDLVCELEALEWLYRAVQREDDNDDDVDRGKAEK
jgi:hypothetical protein